MGIDLEQPSGEYQKEDNIQNVNVVTENGAVEGLYRGPTNVNSHTSARNIKENTGPNGEKVSDKGKKSQTGDEINLNSSKVLEPHDGMEFESKEEAFSFYKEYAKSVGFAGVIKASRRSRVTGKFIDAKFACTRYGSKRKSSTGESPEGFSKADGTTMFPAKRKRGRVNRSWEKTDCKACLHVKRKDNGRWMISSFIKEHNHENFPDQAYYFRGHRNLELGSSDTDALHAIRARTKTMYVTMSRQSVGYKKSESRKVAGSNQLQGGQNLALDEGDAQVMLDHFIDMQDENPNFFYAVDLNKEQQLRNVFWVDAKGRLDYCNFCDVVLFDITFVRNEYKLPLAPFIGVNHHCQFLLLGCALLADETKLTYVWLMRAWLRAMGGHAPKVILTDQVGILKEAIAEVFPDTRHCFCLWHIMNNFPEKLGYMIRQHETFMDKFNKCIFKSWTKEQFEKRWWKMADSFNLRTDVWFQSLYEDRERWVPTYMKGICLAGLSTTQRSESINCFLDKYVQRKTSLKEFMEQYRTILRDKTEEEVKADFETWNKQPALKSPSPFGKQMAAIYTHAIFKKFQVEVLGVVACHPRKESEDRDTKTFRVQDFEENQNFIVEWNETTSDVSCLCRSFEFNGYVCRHVMIVLQMSGVHSIPTQCVLKRWTKDAKSRRTLRKGADVVASRVQRYNDICQRAFKLSDEGSLSQESFNIAFSALEEALRKCESINNSIHIATQPSSPSTHDPQCLEEVNQSSRTGMENKKIEASKKGQVYPEPEIIAIGIQESWQQMEQMNSRNPTLSGYFGGQEVVQGMGQLDPMASNRDDYYSNQHVVQGLGQLNSLAPVQEGHYVTQQRTHGMGQLHFRPQTSPGCFDVQDGLQDMDQSNLGSRSTQQLALESKRVHSKHTSR